MSAHEMTAITCTGCQHAFAENALFCPNCGRPKSRTIGDALVGKLLGDRFQVQELIGQGGSGTIYRAEHINLRRRVAIKILHDELSRDDLAVERFRREATTVAEIDNEHIVEIHDFGRAPDGRLYLAMELLEGETLDTILAREKQLSVERTADILIQVGEALMEAHAIGYVHRDLRPRNIYLANRRGKANFVKLLDFGLAKLVETDAHAASTSLGMTFGDPRYMSPEQARGDRIDRRADIYQLGCVAYEMLTGAPPFTGTRVFDILTKQVSEVPQPLPTRRPGVPLWMEAAAAKMLAKDPENRFATTTRMVEALKRGLETGEVMEDEVARRRESVPPPSVSRVMLKMGLTPDGLPAVPAAAAPALPAAPAPAFKATETTKGIPPVAQKPDSVELLRKRTGTPQLGVPVSASSEHVSEAAGTIEPRDSYRRDDIRTDSRPNRADSDAERSRPTRSDDDRRARRADSDSDADRSRPTRRADSEADRSRRTSSPPAMRGKRPTAEPSSSQVWFDEGEREADDSASATRARKPHSPSVTDLSLYDAVPRKRRGGLILGVIGVLIVGGVAFALTRNGGETKSITTTEPVASVSIDAAPSQIINEEPDASVAATDATATKPIGRSINSGIGPIDHGPIDVNAFVPGGVPKDPPVNPVNPVGPGNPTTIIVSLPPKDPPPKDQGSGSGMNGGPQDPYGNGSDSPTPPPDGTPMTAQQYATQGVQQLINGDTTNAAQSFKKALEVDGNNAMATIGMGEIASRQGLWGDAIAHLTKAARLAPSNAMVFTLLGEAYLRTNNAKEAARHFKHALQLDPNNSRARDGYNEASSKEPPPTDD